MASGAELQDFLDTNAQGLQLLPDCVLRNLSAMMLIQQTYTKILRERGVKTHTVPTIMGSQFDDRSSEALSGYRHKHQTFPLIYAEIPP